MFSAETATYVASKSKSIALVCVVLFGVSFAQTTNLRDEVNGVGQGIDTLKEMVADVAASGRTLADHLNGHHNAVEHETYCLLMIKRRGVMTTESMMVFPDTNSDSGFSSYHDLLSNSSFDLTSPGTVVSFHATPPVNWTKTAIPISANAAVRDHSSIGLTLEYTPNGAAMERISITPTRLQGHLCGYYTPNLDANAYVGLIDIASFGLDPIDGHHLQLIYSV